MEALNNSATANSKNYNKHVCQEQLILRNRKIFIIIALQYFRKFSRRLYNHELSLHLKKNVFLSSYFILPETLTGIKTMIM